MTTLNPALGAGISAAGLLLGRLTSAHQHPVHSTFVGSGVPLGLGVKNMGRD